MWKLATLMAVLASSAQLAKSTTLVSAFWYGWYGTPEVDGAWKHWDHSVLPHWRPEVRARFPEARFVPPHDIHAPFYPQRGLYSSRNRTVLRDQLLDMQRHGIGVAIVSWWGRPGVSAGDSQGVVNDEFVGLAFQEADAVGMSVALHLEPYHGRDVGTVREDVVYLRRRYGRHASWQHLDGRPVYYVYDSYHLPAADWALLLQPEGRGGRFNFTLRAPPPRRRGHGAGGAAGGAGLAGVDGDEDEDEDAAWASRYTDGFFIGLWLDRQHGDDLVAGGFDGAYSYFATEGFSFGSTPANWRFMQEAAEAAGLLFVPCVSPGYDDSKIRPWNAMQKRERAEGLQYRRTWQAAMECGAERIAIATYNEWGEGTQIEAAVPRSIPVARLAPQGLALNESLRAALRLPYEYSDYAPQQPDFYMTLTSQYSAQLEAAFARAHGSGSERHDAIRLQRVLAGDRPNYRGEERAEAPRLRDEL